MLLLPVAGIGILRLYESALLRQTEAELMAQAAVLSAAYRTTWLERAPPGALERMPTVALQWSATADYGGTWIPLLPQLDLADSPILPSMCSRSSMCTREPMRPQRLGATGTVRAGRG